MDPPAPGLTTSVETFCLQPFHTETLTHCSKGSCASVRRCFSWVHAASPVCFSLNLTRVGATLTEDAAARRWVAATVTQTSILGYLFFQMMRRRNFSFPSPCSPDAPKAVICPVNSANPAPGDSRRPPGCSCRRRREKIIFY